MQWERIVEVAQRWWARRGELAQLAREARAEVMSSLTQPTAKQKEAYGRLLHTLCAASISGAAVIVGTATPFFFWGAVKAASLVAAGILLFLFGAFMSKGDG